MWEAKTEQVPGGFEYRVHEEGSVLSFRQFFDHLRSSPEFAEWYSDLLASFEADAFYWELQEREYFLRSD